MKIEPHQTATLTTTIIRYGREPQMDMSTEEVGEYLQALNKFRRSRAKTLEGDRSAIENLCEEIADVIIIMEQMAIIHGYSQVKQKVDEKINRLNRRLNGEE